MPHKHLIWTCKLCNLQFNSRKDYYNHNKIYHNSSKQHPIKISGKCKYCDKIYKTIHSLHLHENCCILNPNRRIVKGHKHTIKEKEHIRNVALNGYKNGTWHGWMNCHSSNKSYPEEFFSKVIENEFEDKNYEYNYQFFQYRLDFAWLDKNKCIEIDGSQHETSEQQKESDIKKDKKLLDEGWQVLRIKWKDLCNYPHIYIQIAKNFINLE